VTWWLSPVAFDFVNCLNLIAFSFFSGPEYLSVFTKPQLGRAGDGLSQVAQRRVGVVSLLWGLWLLPSASSYSSPDSSPGSLALLIVACFAYMADSISVIMLPDSSHAVSGWWR